MRKPTDLLVILTTAVLTALIATPILTISASHAEGEEAAGQNVFGRRGLVQQAGLAYVVPVFGEARPLVTDGLEISLKLGQESYAAGEKPALTLVAVNRSDKKCRTKAKVVMSSTEATDGLSRAMPMPVAVFEREIEIDVAAGQTLKLPLETGYALAGSSTISLTIKVGELFQPAGAFAVAAPSPNEAGEGVQVVVAE